MKKQLLSLVAIFLIAGFSNSVMAQTTVTETTNAGAVLIVPMTITETAALHFGTSALISSAGGTILLPSNSTTRVYGGAGSVATSAVNPQPSNAAYDVSGTPNETYAITLPATITVSNAEDAETMTISSLLAYVTSQTGEAVTGILNGSGADSFTLGGTLTVKTTSTGGVYSGTFDVSVDYN